MRTAEIKRRFLAHFEANGHTVVPSAPLPAIDDPNLLFVPAGVGAFVAGFLRPGAPPVKPGTSRPKRIPPPDNDEVGENSRHGPGFQMKRNISLRGVFYK